MPCPLIITTIIIIVVRRGAHQNIFINIKIEVFPPLRALRERYRRVLNLIQLFKIFIVFERVQQNTI